MVMDGVVDILIFHEMKMAQEMKVKTKRVIVFYVDIFDIDTLNSMTSIEC